MSQDTNIQIIGDATLSVCLFGWCFTSHSKNFHLFGDIIMTGEGLQILTFARHSWPLSSEGFFSVPHLLWHGTSIIMLVSEDPRHSFKIILKNHWANSNQTYRFRHLIIVIVMFLSLLWLRKCVFFFIGTVFHVSDMVHRPLVSFWECLMITVNVHCIKESNKL